MGMVTIVTTDVKSVSTPGTTNISIAQLYIPAAIIPVQAGDSSWEEAIDSVLALESEGEKQIAAVILENQRQAALNEETRLQLEKDKADFAEKQRLAKEQEIWNLQEKTQIAERERIRLRIKEMTLKKID